MENIFPDPHKVQQLTELENEYKKHSDKVFLPNIKPLQKVDYIFIGTEPSLGRWAKTVEEANQHIKDGFCNFIFSLEDFIFKYAIETYLLPSYYITDISKFAIKTDEARKNSYFTWNEGLPLLKQEIETYKNEKTKIVSIGQSQTAFLFKNGILTSESDSILHFSTQNSERRKFEIDDIAFKEYQKSIPTIEDIVYFAKRYLDKNFVSPETKSKVLKNLSKTKELTEEKQRLLFYLRSKFILFQNDWDDIQKGVYLHTSNPTKMSEEMALEEVEGFYPKGIDYSNKPKN